MVPQLRMQINFSRLSINIKNYSKTIKYGPNLVTSLKVKALGTFRGNYCAHFCPVWDTDSIFRIHLPFIDPFDYPIKSILGAGFGFFFPAVQDNPRRLDFCRNQHPLF